MSYLFQKKYALSLLYIFFKNLFTSRIYNLKNDKLIFYNNNLLFIKINIKKNK